MLGKLQPDCFPNLFGPTGDQRIDPDVVRAQFEELAAEVAAAGHPPATPEQLAEGLLSIAVDSMSNAIKKISVARGHDVGDYALACFGGAAGQHACLVADALGMRTVLVHPLAGVLSAYGIGLADQRLLRHKALEAPLTPNALAEAAAIMTVLQAECSADGGRDGFDWEQGRFARTLRVRYEGTDTAIEVGEGTTDAIREAFELAYRQRFTFTMPGDAADRRIGRG